MRQSTMVDLHSHTFCSDGTYTPAQLIEEAETLGLSALTLCDHNTARPASRLGVGKGNLAVPDPYYYSLLKEFQHG